MPLNRIIFVLLLGCSDFGVTVQNNVPIAEPPGSDDEDYGDAPDWSDCDPGYLSRYYNLPWDHPDVEPSDEEGPEHPDDVDWWDDDWFSFERFDASADHGPNWWPVDDGFADDPAYYTVKLTAWLRVFSGGTMQFVMGNSDDAWLLLNDEVVIDGSGVQDFHAGVIELELSSGQYALELLYAHRSGSSGLSFRAVGDDMKICFGEFEGNTDPEE